jgi:hypothetical protein
MGSFLYVSAENFLVPSTESGEDPDKKLPAVAYKQVDNSFGVRHTTWEHISKYKLML